jgi:outer membrane immunogenic protein
LEEFRWFDWSVAMRLFLVAAMVFGAVSSARAADMPDFLRGGLTDGLSHTTTNWEGFYVGGQAGYGSSDENLNGSTNNMVQALIANNVIQQMGVGQWNLNLGKQSSQTGAYGAFAGYNWQWSDVVLGLDASYMHGNFGGSASATQGPLVGGPLSDGNYHAVTVNSTSGIAISDMATFRGRAGYVFDSFMPYAFAGFALGNANITQSVNITDQYAPTFTAVGSCATALVCYALNSTNDLHNHLVYGYTAGLGIDVHLIGGLFFRGEWEYVRFTSTIDTSINTVRAGLGYRF